MSLFYGPIRLPSNHLAGVKRPVNYSLSYIPKGTRVYIKTEGHHGSQKSHKHINAAVAEKCRVHKFFYQSLLLIPTIINPATSTKKTPLPPSQDARLFILVHVQEYRPH